MIALRCLCVLLLTHHWVPSAQSAATDLLARCLEQPKHAFLGFEENGAPVSLHESGSRRFVRTGDDSYDVPPATEVPLFRLAGRQGQLLVLQDSAGDEQFRLLLRNLADGETQQLSPPLARAAAPLSLRRQTVFSGTLGQGDLWGLLAHDGRQALPSVLFQEGGAWQSVSASADGQRLLVQQIFGLYDRVLHVFDQNAGINIPLYFGERPVAIRNADLSPDGNTVYALAALRNGGGRVIEASLSSAEVKIRHISEGPLYEVALSSDGNTLAFLENSEARSILHVFDVEGEAPTHRIALPGFARQLDITAAAEAIGFTLQKPGYPVRAEVLHRKTGYALSSTPGKACAAATLEHLSLERAEDVGGLHRLPLLVIKPTSPAPGPIPVVLAFHGGPESQWVASSHLTLFALSDELGAAIVMPNVVGSTGYGLFYSAADDGENRVKVLPDIQLILDWIRANPAYDAERVAAVGGSYGGYLALLSLAQFPEYIKGAISEVGITHLPTFLGETPLTRRSLRRAEYGDERQPDVMKVLDTLSPYTLADRIEGPVLLIHGVNDARVLVGQARRMDARLSGLGKPVRTIEVAGQGHVLRGIDAKLSVAREKMAFLASLLSP